MTPSLSQQLTDLLGDAGALLPQPLEGYAIDGLTPGAVAQLSDRERIAPVLAWASAQRVTVFPRGGGTQLNLGNVPGRVDLALDLSRCNRILDHQPADLTATVEAGVSLADLQRELAAHGQFLPLEAPLPERATIGGILATNASGPLRAAYGLARDWLIGIGVVSAEGVKTKAGGKVVKNVTGYDLNKLYAGSLGTVGVIAEATFKLAPLPPDWGLVLALFPSLQQGVAAAQALSDQPYAPQGLHLVNGPAARRAGVPAAIPEGAVLAVAFVAGRSRPLGRRLNESMALLGNCGASWVEHLDAAATLPLLRRFTDLGWTPEATPYLGLKLNVPPAATGRVLEGIWEDPALGRAERGIVADPGFGTVRLLWWSEGSDHPADGPAVLGAIERLRGLARGANGTAVVEHCPLAVKQRIDVWGEAPEGIQIMRRIKEQFDPAGILNPGRFVGRL